MIPDQHMKKLMSLRGCPRSLVSRHIPECFADRDWLDERTGGPS